ncbi:MAG: PilZ domain-containing protein [Acidobacteriota bacterium]
MGIRVVLAAAPGAARQAYLEALSALGAEVEVLDSPCDVLEAVIADNFQGLVLDTPTLIRDKSFDRRILNQLEGVFPVIRLRYDHQAGGIRGIYEQQEPGQDEPLSCFILSTCRQFRPRSLRGVERTPLSLPVYLCESPQAGPYACLDGYEKTATLDLSVRGCFVFTVTVREEGTRLWVVFADFNDRTPVPSRVSWSRPWGAARKVPGAGLEFLSLTPGQLDQMALLGLQSDCATLAPADQGVYR